MAAAHLVTRLRGGVDGALANDSTKRRAAPAALVARWLAATTHRAPKGRSLPFGGVPAGLRPSSSHARQTTTRPRPAFLRMQRTPRPPRRMLINATRSGAGACRARGGDGRKGSGGAAQDVRHGRRLDAYKLRRRFLPASAARRPSAYEPAPRGRAVRLITGRRERAPGGGRARAAGGVPVIDGGAAPWTRPRSPAAQPQGPVAGAGAGPRDARWPGRGPRSGSARRACRPAPAAAAARAARAVGPARARMPGVPPFLFVVDASNVAPRHGNKETLSCRGVEICPTTWEGGLGRASRSLPDYLLDARKVAAKKKFGGRPAERTTPSTGGLQRRAFVRDAVAGL